MKRRVNISRFLLFVCMVMLAASVFPHHHHRELFCMQSDIIENVSECHLASQACGHDHSETSSCCENDNTSECNALCVTNFYLSEPDGSQDAMEPHYTLQTILFTLTTLKNLLPCLEQSGCDHYCLYHETLHSKYFIQATGLRSPPCC